MPKFSAIILYALLLAACTRDKHFSQVAANGVTITESPCHWAAKPFDYEYVGALLPVYYIGAASNSVELYDFPIPALQCFSTDTLYEGQYPVHKQGDIELFVDTSITTYYAHTERKPAKGADDEERITVSHMAYPVFMYNHGDSLFFAGEGNRINAATIEAFDSTGNWVQVVGRHSGGCGTNARELMLKPNGMLIAKYPIRSGNTYTRLRLKISRWKDWPAIYSNEFWGWTTFPPPAVQ
jgi:hypothetical protein